jgi:WD40 repeat protein
VTELEAISRNELGPFFGILERLADGLREQEIALNAHELSEIVWLASQHLLGSAAEISTRPQAENRAAVEGEQKPGPDPGVHSPTKPDQPPVRPHVEPKEEPKSPSGTKFNVHAVAGAGTRAGIPLLSPGGRALPGVLQLTRALRPLKRRVPSRVHVVLDEELTARRIAEEDLWLPAERPAPARWLEIALVVDANPSMLVWQQTLQELRLLLEREGAFRDVRLWQLDTINAKAVLRAPNTRQERSRGELSDPTGRRAIIVATDCLGTAWESGDAARMLTKWGRTLPVTILQMLPARLWQQTALADAWMVRLSATEAAQPSSRLRLHGPPQWCAGEAPAEAAVPIATLEPESLGAWANLLAGRREAVRPGAVFLPMPKLGSDAETPSPATPRQVKEGKDRVRDFQKTATPMAFRLACLCAAAPLRLPIMRLIQQTLLPSSRQVHLAEVFLGGLLRRLTPSKPNENADEVAFEFQKEVRAVLLADGLIPDHVQVLRTVSDYVQRFLGSKLNIRAILEDPDAAKEFEFGDEEDTFANISAEVLERLGGRYAEAARRLRYADPHWESAYLSPAQAVRLRHWAQEKGIDEATANLLLLDPNSSSCDRVWEDAGTIEAACSRAGDLFAAVVGTGFVRILAAQWTAASLHLVPVSTHVDLEQESWNLLPSEGTTTAAVSNQLEYRAMADHEHQWAIPIASRTDRNAWGVIEVRGGKTNVLTMRQAAWFQSLGRRLVETITRYNLRYSAQEAALAGAAGYLLRIVQRLLPLLPMLDPVEEAPLAVARANVVRAISAWRTGLRPQHDNITLATILEKAAQLPQATPGEQRSFVFEVTVLLASLAAEGFDFPLAEALLDDLTKLADRLVHYAVQIRVAVSEGPEIFQHRLRHDLEIAARNVGPLPRAHPTEAFGPLWGERTIWELPAPQTPDKQVRAPRLWVRVVGLGADRLGQTLWNACGQLGECLVRSGCGLVVGVWNGVDETVTAAYRRTLSLHKLSSSAWIRQIIEDNDPRGLAGAQAIHVASGDAGIQPSLRENEALILLNGNGATGQIARAALRLGIPVFPIAQTGGDASDLYQEQLQTQQFPRGWSAQKFAFLDDDFTTAIDFLFCVPPLAPPQEEERKRTRTSPIALARTLRGHSREILRIGWHPSGKMIATASVDHTVRIWDVTTGQTLQELRGHSHGVNAAFWSPDGKWLATCSYDRSICIWSTDRWELVRSMRHDDDVPDLAWSRNGQAIASASADRTVRVWEPHTGACVATFNGHRDGVRRVVWDLQEEVLWSAGASGSILKWHRHSDRTEYFPGHKELVTGLAIGGDRPYLVSGSFDRSILLQTTNRSLRLERANAHKEKVRSVSMSADGGLLASNGDRGDDQVILWRTATLEPVFSFEEKASWFWPASIAWSPVDHLLATFGEEDRIVRIWRVDATRLLEQPPPVAAREEPNSPTQRPLPLRRHYNPRTDI